MDFSGADARTRLVAKHREQTINKAREAEFSRAALTKYVSQQGIYVTAANMDDNAELKRRKGELATLAHEEAMTMMTKTAALESRRKAFEKAQEDALAAEIERARRDEQSRRTEIQRICESDPGLRELQVRGAALEWGGARAREDAHECRLSTSPTPFLPRSPSSKWRTFRKSAASN